MNCRTFYGVEIAVMRRFPRPFALGLAVVLATGLLNGVVVRAEAETEFQPRALRRTPSVPVVTVTGAKQDLPPARGVGPQPKPAWPAAATATVALPPRATNRSASAPTQAIRAGALPVSVARPVGGSTTAVAGEPASVRVEVFDHERAQGQGHHVMVFGVGRADGVAEPGQVRVEVDYTGFRSAYGADWSNRLRLVSLPVCALTAPDRPDCRAVPVASANDAAGGRVSAQVTAATGGSLYALGQHRRLHGHLPVVRGQLVGRRFLRRVLLVVPAGGAAGTWWPDAEAGAGLLLAVRRRAYRGIQQPAVVDRRRVRPVARVHRAPLQGVRRRHGRRRQQYGQDR